MRTRFKSLLALGLTFAAGCFVGIVIGSSNPRWFKSFRQPPGPDRAVEHLTEVLELTPEQQEQVREVFIRLRPKRARRTSALPLRFKKTLIASVPPGDKTGFPFRECRTVD